MLSTRDYSEFAKKYSLTENIEIINPIWNELLKIADDFSSKFNSLSIEANYIANKLQNLDSVHSVRWRVKSTDHLIKKIIRKKIENNNKYKNINCENYLSIVNDLIGLRAIHLFKDEGIKILNALYKFGKPAEKPTAYIRSGDDEEQIKKYKESKLKVEIHKSGYRSIHFILPIHGDIETFCEIQIRTIFEEGWGEIDHKLRYPDFSDDQIICSYLLLLNRLAGSADEMGSLAKDIQAHLKQKEKENSSMKDELEKLKLALEKRSQVTPAQVQKLIDMQLQAQKHQELLRNSSILLKNYQAIINSRKKRD